MLKKTEKKVLLTNEVKSKWHIEKLTLYMSNFKSLRPPFMENIDLENLL